MAKDFISRGKTGPDKAVNFGLYLKQCGWNGDWSIDETTGITHLVAYRGDNEKIEAWWGATGAQLENCQPTYTLAGRTIKTKNVSGAAAIACEEPDKNRMKTAVRERKRATVEGEAPAATRTDKYVQMADDALEKMMFGRPIAWVNGISGELQTAEVGGKKTFRIIRKIESDTNARDQIHFVDSYGFHAVYLDAIVSVG